MRFESEGIQHEKIQVAQPILARIGNAAAIGNVGGVVDTVAKDIYFSVRNFNWGDLHVSQSERVPIERVQGQLGNPATLRLDAIKNIAEVFLDHLQGKGIAVAGNLATIKKVETPQFVDAVDVVGMMMGVKDAAHMLDIRVQALLAQVGGCVDQQVVISVLEQDGGSQAFVMRILGLAYLAGAAHGGDTGRGSRSQK